jgi:hypothetical protein
MKLYITTLLLAVVSSNAFAQIRSNNAIANTVAAQSVFLDASTPSFNGSTNNGKGLLFPRTNLTTFTFATVTGNALSFPTAYDGMIVFNSTVGTTPVAGSGIGGQTVSVGYYYFSNPTGGSGNAYATSTGQWLPMGSSPKFNVSTAEVATNTQVNGAQVYAVKGQFTTTGSSTAVTITPPAGMTSLYGITIFKTAGTGNKVVYSKELYSFDSASGAAITGSPSISVVYPADTYDYVIEYLK